MYEQLFLMWYVLPSVMVQSYICYVTKPRADVELSYILLIYIYYFPISLLVRVLEQCTNVARERSNDLTIEKKKTNSCGRREHTDPYN